MLIDIIGKNGFEPTVAITEYAHKKLEKVTKYLDEEASELRMVLKVYPSYHKAELTLLGLKRTIRAEEKGVDMYAAIDLVIDIFLKQIKAFQDKKQRHPKRQDVLQLPTDELEKDVLANQLIRNKKIILKPMKVSEAIEHMESLGHDFFVFLDEATHQAHVVYKREDGNFAVIETKV
jgi:putative sigma-54 modulation protein